MCKIQRLSLLLALAGLLFTAGCQSEPAASDTATETPRRTELAVPKFERDSAFAFVAKQVEFGPRVPNTEAHRQCEEWLVRKFESYGAKVIRQDFQPTAYTGETYDATNIIAQYNPQSRKRIMLAAHWDSRHMADSPLSRERQGEAILGADDGASGVAVLLEIARQLGENPIDLGVDLVLFDAEDQGQTEGKETTWALGSQYWARQPHARPQYGILLDMVGAKGARFPKEQYSVYFAPQLVNKVWTLANRMGYGNYFANAQGGGVTDDHYFVNTIANIPMIDVINLPVNSENKGFGSHWHTHEDDLDVIDKRTLRAVGQVMLAVIYKEASGSF